MKTCIVCGLENNSNSVEHIVSEGFGNKHYTLSKGDLCDTCNNRFSRFEDKALSNSIFVMERARLAVATKKRRNVKGKVKDITIEGAKDFTKGLVTIQGLSQSNFTLNPGSRSSGKLRIPAFDKSEVATSKLLLKIGLESLYKSQKKTYKSYSFQEVTDYLQGITNKDWGFITTGAVCGSFNSIPRYSDKLHLKRHHCHLEYQELSARELLFRFTYGGVVMLINLLGRSTDWVSPYLEQEKIVNIYPDHVSRKLLSR